MTELLWVVVVVEACAIGWLILETMAIREDAVIFEDRLTGKCRHMIEKCIDEVGNLKSHSLTLAEALLFLLGENIEAELEKEKPAKKKK